jgi:hypothetical protein
MAEDRPYGDEETAERQALFLRAFANYPNVRQAARLAGIRRRTHYWWMAHDPSYPPRFEQARVEGFTVVEQTALRMATKGLPKYVIRGGQVVMVPKKDEAGNIVMGANGKPEMEPLIEYEVSAPIVLALLKAHYPDRYSERHSVEVTGRSGGAIELTAKPAEIEPSYLAQVVAELEARRALPAPESDD